MKCAIYTRVSSGPQAAADKVSLPDQEAKCRERAARLGLEVVEPAYCDAGISGELWEERKALQQLIADAKAGRFSVVIAYNQNRLARANEGFSRLGKVFRDHGMRLITDDGAGLDLRDPGAEFMYVVTGGAAVYENRTRAQNIRDKKAAYARRGRWAESVKLYGYTWSRELKRPVVNSEEARGVVLAFRLAGEEHLSCTEIAHRLNAAGIVARVGTGSRGLWYPMTVTRLLAEPRYKGEGWETAPGVPVRPEWGPCRLVLEEVTDEGGTPVLRPRRDGHDKLVVEPGPALVSPEVWAQAQMTAALHRQSRRPWIRLPRLFNGMIWCRCGSRMSSRNHYSRGKMYPYYYCRRADRAPRKQLCDMPNIPADYVDDQVWSFVIDAIRDPAIVRELAEQTREVDLAEVREKRKDLYARLKALRAQQGRALASHARGVYTDEEYLTVKAQFGEEEALLVNEDAVLEAEEKGGEAWDAGLNAAEAALRRMREVEDLRSISREERRALLADLMAQVIISGPKEFRLRSPLLGALVGATVSQDRRASRW